MRYIDNNNNKGGLMQKNMNDSVLENLKDTPVQIYCVEKSTREIHINLNTEITEPYQYGDLNQNLRSLSEEDTVYLHINSPGGRLDSTLELIYNIQQCPAEVVGCLGAEANSAGGMIFLACNSWEIHDLSTMMIHIASGGAAGTLPIMVQSVDHLKELSARVFNKYYKGFLTEEEIEEFMNGKPDMYLFAEDIAQRLNFLQEHRNELYLLEQEEDENEDDD